MKHGVQVNLSKIATVALIAAAAVLPANLSHASDPTIAALGDSLVHGYGLSPSDGFVPQLERWLLDHGQAVHITNAGVSGDTTAGGLARTDWTLTPDVDAIIISLGGNDVLRGIDPAESRSNLWGIMEKARAKAIPILLVGISVPNNFGREYTQDFEQIYPDLAQEFGALYYPNFLSALVELPDRQNVLEQYFQSDALHPNAQGVPLVVEAMGPTVVALINSIAD